MRRDAIKLMVETRGLQTTVYAIRDLLEGRKQENGAQYKLRAEDFSLRALWEGLVGAPEDTLPSLAQISGLLLQEAVDSTAFQVVTRMLLGSKVIEGYNSVRGVGDSLVSLMPSTRRLENIPGFTEMEGMKLVPEGMPYDDSSIGEKYVTTQAFKKGRLISITEEAVMEDQTGQLLMRAQRFGERARIDRERTIIEGIVDKNSNVYRPSGVATALYSVGNRNLCGTGSAISGFQSAVPLVDWNDLNTVEDFHAQSLNSDPQIGTSEPILWDANQLFVPKSLEGVALRIRNATEVRTGVSASATQTIYNNPKLNAFEVVSSPFIARAAVAGFQADWYYGDFKKQFVWHDIWPIQVFNQNASGPEAFERDIVARYKVRYMGGIAALDHRHVVKVKGA